LIGFSDFQKRSYRPDYGQGIDYVYSRTYKGSADELKRRRFAVPELGKSHGSTPVGAGLRSAKIELDRSKAEVKAAVLVTDGFPTDHDQAVRAAADLRRIGVRVLAVQIGGANPMPFLAQACDRVVIVNRADEVPAAVYRLLRGIVRRTRGAA
jgi:hypothetical protein